MPYVLRSAIVGALIFGASTARGEIASEAETLSGHDGVWLRLTLSEKEASALGLKPDTIKAYAITVLKTHGVAASDTHVEQTMIVTVGVDLLDVGQGKYAFSVNVSAHQPARLINGKTALVETWSRGSFGIVGRDKPALLRDAIDSQLNAFAADFVEANKPPADPFSTVEEK